MFVLVEELVLLRIRKLLYVLFISGSTNKDLHCLLVRRKAGVVAPQDLQGSVRLEESHAASLCDAERVRREQRMRDERRQVTRHEHGNDEAMHT